MKVDIVEIGTCDFDTLAGKKNGLFIEPVKDRFDRLPECRKENIAISNQEGEIKIYYIPLNVIKELKLPNWVRGCNSICFPHPTLVSNGWGHLIQHQIVRVERIKNVLEKHGISEIDVLKIDTEGHDCIILNDFIDNCNIKPRVIFFENNRLTKQESIKLTTDRLRNLGYRCKNKRDIIKCTIMSK